MTALVYKPKKFHRHTGEDKDNLALEIARLYYGNPLKKTKGKSPSELTDMGFGSRPTIYYYLDLAMKLGFEGLKKDLKTNHYIRVEKTNYEKFEEWSKAHPITQNELIEKWVREGLGNGGFSGTGVVAGKSHINAVAKLCNFCKVTPSQLIQERDITGEYLQRYLDGLKDGTIPRRTNRVNSSAKTAFNPILMGVRHFIMFHGISIPKGTGGIWNAKVIGHGNYADVRLSEEQFDLMEDYLLKHGGIDSDLYRIVWVGIESCARKEALLNIPLSWTVEDEDKNDVTFFLTAKESKTKHIKDGKQIKHITQKRLQDSLTWLKERNTSNVIWEERISKSKKYKNTLLELKKLWKAIGCTNYYFQEEPFHSLRHIGAHYWLKATDYEFDSVADIGGWTTTTELKTSYGEIPPEVKARKMKRFRKNLVKMGVN